MTTTSMMDTTKLTSNLTTNTFDSDETSNFKFDNILAGGDENKEILLKKEKEDFEYLCNKVLKAEQQHLLAALYYQALHDYALFTPSILITLSSGIFAILVKSVLVPDEIVQTWFAFVIAILAIASTFIQSLMKELNFAGRAGFHDSCSTSLHRLYLFSSINEKESNYNTIYQSLKTGKRLTIGDSLTTNLLNNFDESKEETKDEGKKAEKEPIASEESDKDKYHRVSGKGDDDDKKTTLSSQFQQAIDTCNSALPIQISVPFNLLEARVELVNKSALKENGNHSKIEWDKVMPCLYYQLTETIIQSKRFPMALPEPEWTVDKTLADFKRHMATNEDNNADLIQCLLARGNVISKAHTYNSMDTV
mmetsp:Transcript_68849/g.77038  ORF Transcript_68849/g.77038 Transcript_68849/m.77038 type:complete len:365 (+) Transcript_68849:86-1180(+)